MAWAPTLSSSALARSTVSVSVRPAEKPLRSAPSATTQAPVSVAMSTTAPGLKRLAHSYELLGKEAEHVFPLQFESEVELADGPVRGSVPGFLVLEDFQTRRTRTVI